MEVEIRSQEIVLLISNSQGTWERLQGPCAVTAARLLLEQGVEGEVTVERNLMSINQRPEWKKVWRPSRASGFLKV